MVISETLLSERAPEQGQQALALIPLSEVELIEYSNEVDVLRDAYIAAGVGSAASAADAEHVAIASVAEVDWVVSRDFKHIVHYIAIQKASARFCTNPALETTRSGLALQADLCAERAPQDPGNGASWLQGPLLLSDREGGK